MSRSEYFTAPTAIRTAFQKAASADHARRPTQPAERLKETAVYAHTTAQTPQKSRNSARAKHLRTVPAEPLMYVHGKTTEAAKACAATSSPQTISTTRLTAIKV